MAVHQFILNPYDVDTITNDNLYRNQVVSNSDAASSKEVVLMLINCLRNRFALTVICCLIYHWMEVSR